MYLGSGALRCQMLSTNSLGMLSTTCKRSLQAGSQPVRPGSSALAFALDVKNEQTCNAGAIPYIGRTWGGNSSIYPDVLHG